MALIDRLLGRQPRPKRPKMPALYWSQTGNRSFEGAAMEDALARGEKARRQLEKLPNAADADVDALVRSVQEVYRLGRDLNAIDDELTDATDYEILELLDDEQAVARDFYSSGHAHERKIDYDKLDFDREQETLERWVRAHVPAPDAEPMLKLVVRRQELRRALKATHQGIIQTTTEIGDAARKLEIIAAAQELDDSVGQTADPELAAVHTRDLSERTTALTAGIDEAYLKALEKRPELATLESPAEPTVVEVATELEPSAPELDA